MGNANESVARVVRRVATTLFATAVAFCLGAVAGGLYCDLWVMPGWIKNYSEGGNLAMGVLAYIVLGAFVFAFIVFVLGAWWTIASFREQKNSRFGAVG
ncbi:MAG TPA: hypothetical protein VFI20_01090 [Terracidiphilus sp.]|nr:hypothetical protein [Terracidiphilus sp.]